MKKLTAKRIIEVYNYHSPELTSYSGRYMYGKVCLALDTDDVSHLIRFTLRLIEQGIPPVDVEELVGSMKWDSMGLGYIFYWPHLELTAAEMSYLRDEDEDED